MTSNGEMVKRRTLSNQEAVTHLNGSDNQLEIEEVKQKLKQERENLVLWKKPLHTIHYFIKELTIVLYTFLNR